MIEKWKKAYPAVDVEHEFDKMIAWLESRPKRKKTRRGINKFINDWLSREQDRGGVYRASYRQQEQEGQLVQPCNSQKAYKEMYEKYCNAPPRPDDPFQ